MALIQTMTREIGMTTELKRLDLQFHRRLLVRVIFSTLEGYAFHLRKKTFEAGKASKYAFSRNDLERLMERKEKTQPDGRIKEISFHLPSLAGLRFSIAIFARVMGVPEPPPPRPGDLEAAFAVRDRLTHPKNAASFAISNTDAEILARLGAWFSTVAQWYLRHGRVARFVFSETDEAAAASHLEGSLRAVDGVRDVHRSRDYYRAAD